MTSRRFIGFSLLLLSLCGCGASGFRGNNSTTSDPSKDPSASPISISPTTAVVGSADLTLTITGSDFLGAPHNFSQAVWSSSSSETLLATTFVSSTELTAIVPANLLSSPVTAKIFVKTGDSMGDLPLRKSGSADFSVTALPVDTPMITSISPDSAPAGNTDVTVTIEGSNFVNRSFHNRSAAFWTTCPNLHDCGTMLQTAWAGSSQLTAVIPARLLENPTSVQITVLNGDVMGMSDGYFVYPRSNSVTFTVAP